MNADAEIAELKQQMQRLQEEVADLRNNGVVGSKTEALMALQYDTLPDFYKSPKAVAVHKKIQTAAFFILPAGFIAFVIIIGSAFWKDHQNESIFTHHYEIKVDPRP